MASRFGFQVDPNAELRERLRAQVPEGARMDPRLRDVKSYYDNAASSTTRAMRGLAAAEQNAGRLLNPANLKQIGYYARLRPTERSQQERSTTPFLGRREESDTFVGQPRPNYSLNPEMGGFYTGNSAGTTRLPEGEAFDMSSFLRRQSSPMESGIFSAGGPAPAPVSPFNLDAFLGRSAPVDVSVSSVADSVSGMMGGGLVGSRTPFRKGRAMDRMVAEMTRNISNR